MEKRDEISRLFPTEIELQFSYISKQYDWILHVSFFAFKSWYKIRDQFYQGLIRIFYAGPVEFIIVVFISWNYFVLF